MTHKVGLGIGHYEDQWEENGSKGIKLADGTHWEEFWFNAAVGKIAYHRLKEHGFDVILPQGWDSQSKRSLRYKSDMFNRENTELNVEIHANAGPKNAKGACIFYWHTSQKGKLFAEIWKKNFDEMCPEQGFHGNGSHESKPNHWTNFHIIRETQAVTDLIEHGFFTTPEQLENLKKPDFQNRCAEVIVKSVCQYFGVKYKEIKVETLEVDMLDKAIVINAFPDFPNAEILAARIKAPIYVRSALPKGKIAKTVFVVGGNKDGLQADEFVMLTGPDRFAVSRKVEEYLK